MPTRSAVIVKDEEGYRGIYCHYDGSHSGVGKTLVDNFNNKQLALAIVA